MVKGQTFVFSTGRRISVTRDVVGISPHLEVFQGSCGVLLPSEPFLDDDDALTSQECVELADYMLGKWQDFKAMQSVQPDKENPF